MGIWFVSNFYLVIVVFWNYMINFCCVVVLTFFLFEHLYFCVWIKSFLLINLLWYEFLYNLFPHLWHTKSSPSQYTALTSVLRKFIISRVKENVTFGLSHDMLFFKFALPLNMSSTYTVIVWYFLVDHRLLNITHLLLILFCL
jgi:hypothetical protein